MEFAWHVLVDYFTGWPDDELFQLEEQKVEPEIIFKFIQIPQMVGKHILAVTVLLF